MRFAPAVFAVGVILAAAAPAPSQIKVTFDSLAPEFPPGPFTDGGQYKLSDCAGKVVVLYFFENKSVNGKTSIRERMAIVKKYQGKPVKFFAVGANMTLAECLAFQRETGLAVPIFADYLGLMQARHGFTISNQNIWQTRIVSPEGKIQGIDFSAAEIDKVLEKNKVEPRFKLEDYDTKLAPVIDLLEYSQYVRGLKALAPLRKSPNKALAESAQKLFGEIVKEGEQWKGEATASMEEEPQKAYDLYAKLAAVFPTEELGKAAAEPMKKLAAEKTVAAEVNARKAFAALTQNLGQVGAVNRNAVRQSFLGFAKKHAGTPTGERAGELAAEMAAPVAK